MHQTIKKYFSIPVVIDIFAAADATKDRIFKYYDYYYNSFLE